MKHLYQNSNKQINLQKKKHCNHNYNSLIGKDDITHKDCKNKRLSKN